MSSRTDVRRITEAEHGDNPVYAPDVGGPQHGYFGSVEELRDHCDAWDKAVPKEVQACTKQIFQLPSADELIRRELEDGEHWPDMGDHLTECDDLRRAVEEWNARQTAYDILDDPTRIVVLNQPETA